jgi:hypothetical protein
MWNHAIEDIHESSSLPFERTVAPVRPDASASEVILEKEQYLRPIPVLADGEAGSHFPTHEDLLSRCDGNGETALPIRISGDVGG